MLDDDNPRANQPRRGSVGLARRGFFACIAIIAFALLVWLGWTGAKTRGETRAASQRAVRVAELRGTIAYLDEWLTMSAQMAAASGDHRWVERFDEAAPKLDAAITQAAELATPEVKAALASTTNEAYRDLVTMERRALALVAAGDLAGARSLLGGPEFDYLKDVYATGIEVFGQELKTFAAARADDLNDRAWMEAAGLGLCAILLVAIALSVRGHNRLQGALARTATVARTDALTDLPNRRQFYEELDAVLAAVERTGNSHALLLIDLDRFKAANDAYGHPAGDQLLQLVAIRLRTVMSAGDLIARLGGDEFAVVVASEATGPSSRQNVVAELILAAMRKPFALAGGIVVQMGASVGIALATPGFKGIGDLLHRADIALSQAKTGGRGCFRVFEHGMDVQARARALLEGDLRKAIADDAIVPYYQPLIEFGTGRLIGVEMLARWTHPERGMVSPAEFIPLAEEMGLIVVMTDQLMRHACRAAAHWPAHLTLACNVSPVHLRDPGLPALVRTILRDTGFPANRLEIEVTESALLSDLGLARTLLDQIKALGVRLALDDFGTGYSSLRHLQTLPFDKLKIDSSFVGAMATDKESRTIVSAVVGLGHSLGLSTVAEGVETEETAAMLRELHCDIGQGWLFGRPAPASSIDALMREAKSAELVPAAMVA